MKLSIVTINRNNAEGLRRTMESVFTQTCKEFEYIVIDGGSTDGSVEVIKEYIKQLENFQWISEPDTGIYNAMNKGLKTANGEYTLMLNSGDFLVNEHVLEWIMPELDDADIVQGNTIEEQSEKLYRNKGYGRSNISMYDVMEGVFLHQASFCKRELFDKYGFFDESYRIAADTKFFINCIGFHDVSFKYVDIDVTNYDCHGISAATDGVWHKIHIEEYIRLRREMFSPMLESYLRINEPKVQWYDRLHQHAWLWNMVRLISHIHDCIYGAPKYGVRKEETGKR